MIYSKGFKNIKSNSSTLVAKKIVSSLKRLIQGSRAKSTEELLRKLHTHKNVFFSHKHDTEAFAHNAALCVLHTPKTTSLPKLKEALLKNVAQAESHISVSKWSIADAGYSKIRRGMDVYVHGYSSSVLNLLVKAKNQGIHFIVHTPEIRPMFDGRLMATELAHNKIEVKTYADLALRIVIKKADLVLMGADSISQDGKAYATIGSELVADIAEKYDVPVYICADTWKFSPEASREIERSSKLRPENELWGSHPRNISVINYGFEKISPRLITGVITESGIFKMSYISSEVKRRCPWIK